MSKRTFTALLVLILILAAVIFVARRKTDTSPIAVEPILSVAAYNQTRNVPATGSDAKPQDVVVYTLTVENPSNQIITGYVIQADISGISNNATLIDGQGASYNSSTNSLIWTPLDIPANGKVQKQFSVRINPLAAGINSAILSIRFNNQLQIAVAKPIQVVAGTSTTNNNYKAPVTGPAENVVWALALLTTISVFAIRKFRKQKKLFV